MEFHVHPVANAFTVVSGSVSYLRSSHRHIDLPRFIQRNTERCISTVIDCRNILHNQTYDVKNLRWCSTAGLVNAKTFVRSSPIVSGEPPLEFLYQPNQLHKHLDTTCTTPNYRQSTEQLADSVTTGYVFAQAHNGCLRYNTQYRGRVVPDTCVRSLILGTTILCRSFTDPMANDLSQRLLRARTHHSLRQHPAAPRHHHRAPRRRLHPLYRHRSLRRQAKAHSICNLGGSDLARRQAWKGQVHKRRRGNLE